MQLTTDLYSLLLALLLVYLNLTGVCPSLYVLMITIDQLRGRHPLPLSTETKWRLVSRGLHPFS